MAGAHRKTTKSPTDRGNTVDELIELREAVEQLSQIVKVLTQAIDELSDELQWRNNQAREQAVSAPPPFVLHSLPRDPCSDDWKINRVRTPTHRPQGPPATPPRETLFD